MTQRPGPILAIDIGGTKIAAAVVAPDGQLSYLRHLPTEAQQGAEALIGRVIALIEELRQAAAEAGDPAPLAVGLGTAGFIHPQTGAVAFATAALPGWQGMPVRQRVAQAVGLPVFVDNDAHMMALGEAAFGAGRGYTHLIGLTVGTGIGGGVIIDGRIYYGAEGAAGAAGHIIVDYQRRRRCPCGNYGCLEAYAAAPSIVADFVRAVGKNFIRRELGLEPENVGVKEIAALLQAGHPDAWYPIWRAAGFLGLGIATLLNLFNPELVVIGGGVAQIGERYLNEVRRVVYESALPNVAGTPILPAVLGPQANLVGAAELAWQGLAEGKGEVLWGR